MATILNPASIILFRIAPVYPFATPSGLIIVKVLSVRIYFVNRYLLIVNRGAKLTINYGLATIVLVFRYKLIKSIVIPTKEESL